VFRNLDRVFLLASKRYATSLYVWLLSAPFLTLGLVLTELSSDWAPEKALPVLAAGVIAHLALGVVLWVASKTVLSNARRVAAGWKQVLFVYVMAGLVRGISIGYFIELFGVGDAIYQTRISTAIVLVVFSFTFVAYSAELWSAYRDKRLKLLTSIAVGEKTDSLREIAAREFRPLMLVNLEKDVEVAREQTKAALSSIRQKIRSQEIDPSQLKQVFDESDQNWRTLSHKAWIGSLPNVPRISFLELLRTLAISKPISLIVLSSGPVYGFTRVFDTLEPSQAILGGLIWWVGVLGLAFVTNNLAAKAKHQGLFILLLGFIAIQALAYTIGLLFLVEPGSQVEILFVSLVSSTAAVALGLPPALERLGQVVLDQLERRLDNTALDSLKAQGEMFVLAQRIGAYLHSEVRGDFLRHSLALREALEKGEKFEAEKILDQLDRLVAEINLEQPERSPIENLKHFLDNWNGVIEITHNLNEVTIPERLEKGVEEIVMEAVNNAVRHGEASWVAIEVKPAQGGVGLRVENDSSALGQRSLDGLGTKTLHRNAPQNWERRFIRGTEGSLISQLRATLSPLPR
jgi:hypothetical protein